MRVLTFTKLYPNACLPEHGIFVARRVQALAQQPHTEVQVIAPVPYYPQFLPARGEWEKLKRVPRQEQLHALTIYHPRYFNPPKVGMTKYGAWMAQGSQRAAGRLFRAFPFDLIDAHFVYPDGFAALKLSERFGRPLIVTARGSDVSRNKNIPQLVPLLQKVVRGATQLIAVSEELRDDLIELGASPANVHVIPNGIDLATFHPMPMAEARQLLQLDPRDRWLISVARLDHNKGQHLILEALKKIGLEEIKKRRIKVALIGKGEARAELEQLTHAYQLQEIVVFAGQLIPEKIRIWYNAADVKILASRREGSPNVVLEALACGTPVLASRAGRNATIIKMAENGYLFSVEDPASLAELLLGALDTAWNRESISRTARERSWNTVAAEVATVFRLAMTK